MLVNQAPNISINPGGNVGLCQGSNILLNVLNGVNINGYLWSNGSTNSSISINQPGTFSVNVIDANGCSANSQPVTIVSNPLPIANITANGPLTFCEGDSVLLSANIGVGLSYSWKLNGNNIGTNNPTLVAMVGGVYSLLVTDLNGCSATSNPITVTMVELPNASITASFTTTICQGDSVILNANSGTSLTFQWKLNDNNISGATNSTFVAYLSGNYSVIVTNNNNCSSTSQFPISVQVYTPPPLPNANDAYRCGTGTFTLQATGGSQYKWYSSPNGGNPIFIGPTFVTPILSNTTTYFVSNFDSCESFRIPVTAHVINLTVNAGNNNTITCGNTVLLNSSSVYNGSGSLNYLWTPPIGLSSDTISNPIASPTQNTIYVVTVSDGFCSASDSASINVNPLAVNAGSDKSIVCGAFAQLNALTNFSGSGLTYLWSPSYGLNSTSISNPIANPDQTTQYSIQVFKGACSHYDYITINVNPADFNLSFNSNTQILYNPPFAVQFVNNTPNLSNYTFTWYFGDGSSLQSNNSTVFHQFSQNGLYDVTLLATKNSTGCGDTLYQNDYIFCAGGINCTHAATINQTNPITTCLGDSVLLTCNTVAGATYQWNYNGAIIPNSNNTTYNATASGYYSVTIILNNCPVTSSAVTVQFYNTPAIPIVSAIGSLSNCGGGGSVTLNAPAGYASYMWSNGTSSQSTTVTTSGNYTVVVTNSNGCVVQSLPFLVGASPMGNPNICLVTVDSLTGNNKIIWNETNTTFIDHYNVYGEGSQANIFNLLGTVPYNSLSVFTDILANPFQQSYRYKLSAVDTCGAETSLSPFHKTIHLTINQGVGSTYNLLWSFYEGFDFSSYNIYRGTSPSNISLITTLANTLNSYTDLNPPNGNVYYQIEAVNPTPCSPSKAIYTNARSNIASNKPLTSFNENNSSSVNLNIYPNPASDYISVEYNGYLPMQTTTYVNLYTLDGKLIKSQLMKSNVQYIGINELPSGFYIIKLQNKQDVLVKNFIKG